MLAVNTSHAFYVTEWHRQLHDGDIERYQVRLSSAGYQRSPRGCVTENATVSRAACLWWPGGTPEHSEVDAGTVERLLTLEGYTERPVFGTAVMEVSIPALKDAGVEIGQALHNSGYLCREEDFGRHFVIFTHASVPANEHDVEALLRLMPTLDPARIRRRFSPSAAENSDDRPVNI